MFIAFALTLSLLLAACGVWFLGWQAGRARTLRLIAAVTLFHSAATVLVLGINIQFGWRLSDDMPSVGSTLFGQYMDPLVAILTFPIVTAAEARGWDLASQPWWLLANSALWASVGVLVWRTLRARR